MLLRIFEKKSFSILGEIPGGGGGQAWTSGGVLKGDFNYEMLIE